ncbi:uncharacterized protein LOC136029368 isoform X2 [Artemia franciscana]|uniref:uncharacterized protein LOC136029368 isoform X2 n=1 Tax=Artemia franciscana TaxID=6661 RepID=UPI0032DB12F6
MNHDWDNCKENIQPLKSGRKMQGVFKDVDELNISEQVNNLSLSHGSSIANSEIKRKFEDEIRLNNGDDLLDPWHRYIAWMEEACPTGGVEVRELYEKCLIQFKDSAEYFNDTRLLKLWLRYIQIKGESSEDYKLLYSRKMFQTLAKFYISWAQTLESIGSTKEATKIFNKGIEKNAEPSDLLKSEFSKFQARVARQCIADNVGPVPEIQDENKRAALSRLTTLPSGVVPTERVSLKSAGRLEIDPQSVPNSNALKIQVFDENTRQPLALPRTEYPSKTAPIDAQLERENQQKPSKWTESKLNSRVPIPVVPVGAELPDSLKPKFSVHVEDEAYAAAASKVVAGCTSVLKSRSAEPGTSHLVQRENVDINQNIMCRINQMYAGVMEYSFEQLRAMEESSKMGKRIDKYVYDSGPDDGDVSKRKDSSLGTDSFGLQSTSSVSAGSVLGNSSRSSTNGQGCGSDAVLKENYQTQPVASNQGLMLTASSLKQDDWIVPRYIPEDMTGKRFCWDFNKVYREGRELSFEQIRAMEMKYEPAAPAVIALPSKICVEQQTSPLRVISIGTQVTPDRWKTNVESQTSFNNGHDISAQTSLVCQTSVFAQTPGLEASPRKDELFVNRSIQQSSHLTSVSESIDGKKEGFDSTSTAPSPLSTTKVAANEVYMMWTSYIPDPTLPVPVLPLKRNQECDIPGRRNPTIVVEEPQALMSKPNFQVYVDPEEAPGTEKDSAIENPQGFQVLVEPVIEKPQAFEVFVEPTVVQAAVKASIPLRPALDKPSADKENATPQVSVRPVAPTPAPRSVRQDSSSKKHPEHLQSVNVSNNFKDIKETEVKQRFPICEDHSTTPRKKFIFEDDELSVIPQRTDEVITDDISVVPGGRPLSLQGAMVTSTPFLSRPPDHCLVDNDITNIIARRPLACQPPEPIPETVQLPDNVNPECHPNESRFTTMCARGMSPIMEVSREVSSGTYSSSGSGSDTWNTGQKAPRISSLSAVKEVSENSASQLRAYETEPLEETQKMEDFIRDSIAVNNDPGIETSFNSEKESESFTDNFDPSDESAKNLYLLHENLQEKSIFSNVSVSNVFQKKSPARDNLGMSNLELSDETFEATVNAPSSSEWNIVAQDPFLWEERSTLLTKKGFCFPSMKNFFLVENSLSDKLRPGQIFSAGCNNFIFQETIGSGNYAKVLLAYKAENNVPVKLMALKKQGIEDGLWEFYVCTELRKRLQSSKIDNKLSRLMSVDLCLSFHNCCLLINEYHELGSLLDLINKYKIATGSTMPEGMVMFLTLEMLEIMDILKSVKFIHGDIKPDNVLIQCMPDVNFSLKRKPFLKLIDFGRAIDVSLYPPSTAFSHVLKIKDFQCLEMQKNLPWTYQLDAYNFACTIATLLSGNFQKPTEIRGEFKFCCLKRWHNPIWHEFFSALLNIPSRDEAPDYQHINSLLTSVFEQCFAKDLPSNVAQMGNILKTKLR